MTLLEGSERPVCACTIHPTGRGVLHCMYHDKVLQEHRAMYHALAALRDGKLRIDPAGFAETVLADVKWRH